MLCAVTIKYQVDLHKVCERQSRIYISNSPVWGDTGGSTRPEGAKLEFELELLFGAGGDASELVIATKGDTGERFGARRRESSLSRFGP